MSRAGKETNLARALEPGSITVTTSLYDLVNAVMSEVSRGEEELVPLVVSHILRTRRPRKILGRASYELKVIDDA